ncbi:unnamed protein product [Urochloa humidicola]
MAGAKAAAQHRHHHCSICMEPMAPGEAHRGGAACAHAFCRACLSGHVRAKLESGGDGSAVVVWCPNPSCGRALDPELCRAALPFEVFERWCYVLCESMSVGARNTYLLPVPGLLRDDGGRRRRRLRDPVGVPGVQAAVLRAVPCGADAPWHAGVTCDVDEYQRVARDREDRVLYKMAEEMRRKRCPKCHFFIDKIDNCPHIRCSRGFEFCYRWVDSLLYEILQKLRVGYHKASNITVATFFFWSSCLELDVNHQFCATYDVG